MHKMWMKNLINQFSFGTVIRTLLWLTFILVVHHWEMDIK